MFTSLKEIIKLFTLILILLGLQNVHAQHTFQTEQFRVEVNEKGQFEQLTNRSTRQNYLPGSITGYLFRIRINGKDINPLKAKWDQGKLQLRFPEDIYAQIAIQENESYLSFELQKINPANKVDAVLWGPVASTIAETIGEIVGVARNGDFAIGIQSLNPKTAGGVLKNEEGTVYERGTAGIATDYGSSLQAFTVNHNKKRVMKVWNKWKNVPVKTIEEGKLQGSKIALFGTVPSNVLPTIGEIEKKEGLPHPMINGKWIKQSREVGRPYMISGFSESNVDTLLDYAEMAGMAGLYHEGPFATWGHFKLKKDLFPNGRQGLKKCVEKAKKRGLRLGVHTLTNFITTNDPFVTPKPDKHLQEIGSSVLARSLSEDDKEIFVKSRSPFLQKTNLQTVRVGNELIRYQKITDTKPYKLTDCVRAAFGTKQQDHRKGASISKLMDHGYEVFFPDWELQKTLLDNMTEFFNETGVTQMDFDGHEGTFSTGMGDFSFAKFARDFYHQVDHNVVNGSSRSNHFYWHINHYLNWGEPWYGGFRKSQSNYRFNNQALLDRNYMPNMLGWFLMTPTTTMEDIDWMMARAAGYDAGFAFVARLNALKNNPQTNSLLHQIKIWELARQKGIFSKKQEEALRNPDNVFHLEKNSPENWKLHTFEKFNFTHQNRVLQPGQPTHSEWSFENEQKSQVPQIRLLISGEDGSVSNLSLEINNFFKLELSDELKAGQSLVLDNSNFARLYDNKGRFIRKIKLTKTLPELNPGKHNIQFDCEFSGKGNLEVEAKVKLKGEVQSISY